MQTVTQMQALPWRCNPAVPSSAIVTVCWVYVHSILERWHPRMHPNRVMPYFSARKAFGMLGQMYSTCHTMHLAHGCFMTTSASVSSNGSSYGTDQADFAVDHALLGCHLAHHALHAPLYLSSLCLPLPGLPLLSTVIACHLHNSCLVVFK